jgi:ubiquinone/menaquinone biosynthesis C-methylase UbiE/uncharacterized protein YbaR (Trm112 family)
MNRSALRLLCCPSCHCELALQDASRNEILEEGRLFCSTCQRRFPIRDGIARFISLDELEGLNSRFARFYERFSRFETILDKLAYLPIGGERKGRQEVLSRLELEGGRVLEVSIGSGGNLPNLFESSRAGEVFGLDISPAQLTLARKLVDKHGWPVELFLGMAEALPFRAESFDNVFHVGGINFFSDKRKAIEEMIRVAKPGSRIVIADESEQVARTVAWLLRLSREVGGGKVDTSVPAHLVPETMEEIQTYGIWKRHGHHHGYVLEFRKPALEP